MTVPLTDTINRTALLGVQDGTQPTIDAALTTHATTGMAIVADTTPMNLCGQAALCTAVATAVRAFGQVTVVADGNTILTAGPHRGRTVAQILSSEGARLLDHPGGTPESWPTLHLGTSPPAAASNTIRLTATWNGWAAHVQPADVPADVSCGDNVLAAIAAAALGVHEAFGAVRNRPGCDAGRRTITLNLWHPGDRTEGPGLTHAPSQWWLVGLGHLGQANAWVLSWLPYPEPSDVQIVLQDTQHVVDANHSTGLLTPAHPQPRRKTRLVAAALDILGYDTVIVERRLDTHTRVLNDDVHVALLGVDALEPRRLISSVGWKLAIDAGLGAGPTDFNAILLRRFPAETPSHQVPGWANDIPRPRNAASPALADLKQRDPCGTVRLANTAVGASFVGAITACLAVAQAIRATLTTGTGFDVINLHLQSDDIDLAPPTLSTDVTAIRLI
ncbi:hypothetical protein ACFQS1_35085 [Paractinoplanes rhizophilus]|uniref:Thiamine biosynthesis protein ThiF n=1 Tax=Paractinoplanes rhizophilus TaxID=1416877 RepID=A0ABW2I2X5_9ACTN